MVRKADFVDCHVCRGMGCVQDNLHPITPGVTVECDVCLGAGGFPMVARHHGLPIYQTPDGLFHADNGWDTAAECEDSIEDAARAIERYWSGDEHGPLNGFFTGADA